VSEPRGITTVHLVRHGEVHNPDGILYGRLPGYHLSDAGREMAATTAAFLAGRDIALVVSSPLQRAVETAAAIADRHGLPVPTDDRLIESASVLEGHRVRRARDLLEGDLLRHMWNPFRPSWGEPFRAIARRMLAAADAARRQVPGREAVCVSHQQPIWVARRALEGRPLWHRPDRRECALASVTTIRYDADGLALSIGYAEPAGGTGRRTGVPPETG
jgi:broad specificity phosphatase PhoE